MKGMRPAGFLVVALLCALPLALPAFTPNQDIVVHVRKEGAGVAIDVVCPVDAPWQIVWDVMTDYAHMPEFISNIQYSVVEEQNGNVLHVRQKGKASRGPLTLTYDMLREVELVPQSEIRSRLISGDLKSSDFVTKIVQAGDHIDIVNNGRYVPKMWVPPVIGPAMIEAETQKQFGEFRAEILRRSALARPQS
jgi:polyketide cyclase/dehydrase/lipid transport protein